MTAWPWWRGYVCSTNRYYNVHNCWLRRCGREPYNGRWT